MQANLFISIPQLYWQHMRQNLRQILVGIRYQGDIQAEFTYQWPHKLTVHYYEPKTIVSVRTVFHGRR